MADNPFAGISQAIGKVYPRLGTVLQDAEIGYGTPPKGQEQNGLEFYPPWESENPTEGKVNLQIYDKGLSGQQLHDAVAADTLHYLGAVDPRTNTPVDSDWLNMKQNFMQSMTPQQRAIDDRAYTEDVAAGENRSYSDWMQNVRLDAYLRGGLFPSINPEWQKPGLYSPVQKQLLNEMRQYLQRAGGASDSAYLDRMSMREMEKM